MQDPITDKTHFPMIWVESLRAYLHWLPITKIQFEYFMCAEPREQFDATWYQQLNQKNPRQSPYELTPGDFQGAFLTGILPRDAQLFADWCGRGEYSIPKQTEWQQAYEELKARPMIPDIANWVAGLNIPHERIRALLIRIEEVTARSDSSRNLAGQMLMERGIREWVMCRQTPWGFLGGSRLRGRRADDPEPVDLETLPGDEIYGFRLLRRPRKF